MLSERPKVVLRSGVVLEFPEESRGEIQDIDAYLNLEPGGTHDTALPEWIGVTGQTMVRTADIACFTWGDARVHPS